MRVLVVGGGAVGQVLGAHLARGGAQVHLLVRPGRAESAARGFQVRRLRRLRPTGRLKFQPSAVLTTVAQADGQDWDLAVLCVSSPALREPWLAELGAVLGAASLATVTQGPADAELMYRVVGRERSLFLIPALIAWEGALTGESNDPGTQYWLPPGAAQIVGGDSVRGQVLVEALRRGGLRARHRADAAVEGARTAARSIPFIAALEIARWSFKGLRSGPYGELASRASREALAGISVAGGGGEAPSSRRARWSLTKLALLLLPRLTPFDLERYAEAHFRKTGSQTRLMLDDWTELAGRYDLPVHSLQELSALLAELVGGQHAADRSVDAEEGTSQ